MTPTYILSLSEHAGNITTRKWLMKKVVLRWINAACGFSATVAVRDLFTPVALQEFTGIFSE